MDVPDELGAVEFLQDWYLDQCNGDWEHEFGVTIATLDNPGWILRVDLSETRLDGKTLEKIKLEPGGGRWIWVASDGHQFTASCDPLSLRHAIVEFQRFSA